MAEPRIKEQISGMIRFRQHWQRVWHIRPTSEEWLVLVKRLWVAIFIAFLFLRMTIIPFWAEQNRFFFHWQRTDALAIVALIVGIGIFLFICYQALRSISGIGRALANLAFLLFGFFYLRIALLETVFSDGNIPTQMIVVFNILHLALVMLFVVLPVRAVRLFTQLCLMMSPVMALFVLNIAFAQPYRVDVRSDSTASPVAHGQPAIRHIHWVIFDGLSYNRLFYGERVLPQYGGFARLADQSMVFHDVRPPAGSTFQSVPQMLFGAMGHVVLEGAQLQLDTGTRKTPLLNMRSVFTEFRERGYLTHWYGMYLPAGALIGDELDYGLIRNPHYKPMGRNLPDVSASLLLQHVGKRLSGFFPFFRCFDTRVRVAAAAEYNAWLQHRALEQVRDQRPTFSFIHYLPPHEPLIYDRDGLVSDLKMLLPVDSLAGYKGALRAVDRMLNELLDEMHVQSGDSETLLVVTSDHGFRDDPNRNRDEPLTVPLFIRLPDSRNTTNVFDSVSLVHLKDALVSYIDGTGADDIVLRLTGKEAN